MAGVGRCSKKCSRRSRIDSCIGSSSMALGSTQRTSVDSLLSSDDCRSSVERAAKLHPLWHGPAMALYERRWRA